MDQPSSTTSQFYFLHPAILFLDSFLSNKLLQIKASQTRKAEWKDQFQNIFQCAPCPETT